MSARKIVVLGTGGTIAGRAASAHDNLGYTAAQVGVADLLAGLPGLAGVDLHCEQVAQIDSKDMDFAVWRALARRCAHWLEQEEVAGVVITHGTDTMEETAFFLASVLAADKPVVLTGAMRPASSLAADGPQNLLDAVTVAGTAGASGVLVCFAGTLLTARQVSKLHPYRADAFGCDDGGPLGYVEEGRVRLLQAWPRLPVRRAVAALPPPAAWPRVEIVASYAGASGALVDALVQQGVDGLVVAGTGNGTLHHALEAALQRARAAGVAVRRSTRCPFGQVLAADPHHWPPAQPLPPVKARIALLLDLMD